MISKAKLAQRARREREKNLKQDSTYQLRQRSQLKRTNKCVNSVPHAISTSVTQPDEKRQRVDQTSTSLSFMPSTSSHPQTNW